MRSRRRLALTGMLVALALCTALMAWLQRTSSSGGTIDEARTAARTTIPERTVSAARSDLDDTPEAPAPSAEAAADDASTPTEPAPTEPTVPTTVAPSETAQRGQPTLPPQTTPAPAPPVEPSPSRKLLFGVSTETNATNAADLAAREAAVGTSFDVVGWFADWTEPYRAEVVDAIAARGSVPMLYWEPWDHTAGSHQPNYTMAAIASGAHDTYLDAWARAAAAHGRDLWLVYAPEMNTRWVPWGVNGVNRAADVVAAWRRVHAIFTAAGASNVTFVWSPASSNPETTPLAQVFPGASAVDVVGFTMFNGGTALDWGGWMSFEQLYTNTRRELAALAPAHPVMLTSVGSTEAGGDKAAWVRSMFSVLNSDPQVAALVWFDHDKETNWRMDSSPSSLAVFAEELAAR